jgi:cellulose biosynthesis protein BcsQ
MRRVFALGSNKGGVAKTTSALYLATRAAQSLGARDGEHAVALVDRDESKNLSRLLSMRPELLRPGVDLVAGTDIPSGYRVVIIDTPPGLSAIPSLQEADGVLVPVLPEDQAVTNLVLYLRDIDSQRLTVSPRLRLLALLPTMVQQRIVLHRERLQDIQEIAAAHQPPVLVLPAVPWRARIANFDLSAPEYDLPAQELFRHAQLLAPHPA